MHLHRRERQTGPYRLFWTSNNVNFYVNPLTDSHEDHASCHVQASNWTRDTPVHLACDSCSKITKWFHQSWSPHSWREFCILYEWKSLKLTWGLRNKEQTGVSAFSLLPFYFFAKKWWEGWSKTIIIDKNLCKALNILQHLLNFSHKT